LEGCVPLDRHACHTFHSQRATIFAHGSPILFFVGHRPLPTPIPTQPATLFHCFGLFLFLRGGVGFGMRDGTRHARSRRQRELQLMVGYTMEISSRLVSSSAWNKMVCGLIPHTLQGQLTIFRDPDMKFPRANHPNIHIKFEGCEVRRPSHCM